MGKSTLFNRLTKTRAAIVNDTSGTTRDRQYGLMEWNGMEMSVVDTGGWVEGSDDIFESEINKQVYLAIEEADVILFMVDIKTGITDLDDHVAEILRRGKKPVVVVVNKDDNNQGYYGESEFYALGLGQPFAISATALATCSTRCIDSCPRRATTSPRRNCHVLPSWDVPTPANHRS